jgi:Sigma-70 region 2
MSNPAASFEPYRRRLLGLAYRMLGSMADAEDAVQETYLRWHAADRDSVSDPTAFLMTTTTRICLDMLTSARARREEYVGPWLPDPVVDTAALAPDSHTELAEDLSIALLLTRSCSTTSSTSRSAKWPRRWSEARRHAGSLPPAHARMCAQRNHAAQPRRRRVRARSIRNMRSSCRPSSRRAGRAI